METAGTYKMTRAGQITIPREIREEMKLEKGSQLDFYYDSDMILIRKKRTPLEVYETLAKKTHERFKRQGITRKDVEEAVEAARNELYSR
ncbi:MAG: AbrB/MazE/SpoVT family DNA-binding domain-containing protein [Candidatus Altiarchaeota archaeon]|nr:AbrB/MazE/SpoVT family DNA-binding domain-containing protein [Candidatus Altiarchaeota archaeon]